MDLEKRELKFEPIIPFNLKIFIYGLASIFLASFPVQYVRISTDLARNVPVSELRALADTSPYWFAKPFVKKNVDLAIYLHNRGYNIVELMQEYLENH